MKTSILLYSSAGLLVILAGAGNYLLLGESGPAVVSSAGIPAQPASQTVAMVAAAASSEAPAASTPQSQPVESEGFPTSIARFLLFSG